MKKLAYAVQNKHGEYLTGFRDRYFTPHLGMAAIRPRVEEAESLREVHMKMVENRDDLVVVHVVPLPECVKVVSQYWSALYANGQMVAQGRPADLDELISKIGLIGIGIAEVTPDAGWLQDHEHFPGDYADVKLATETEEAEEEPTSDLSTPGDVSGDVDLEPPMGEMGGSGL